MMGDISSVNLFNFNIFGWYRLLRGILETNNFLNDCRVPRFHKSGSCLRLIRWSPAQRWQEENPSLFWRPMWNCRAAELLTRGRRCAIFQKLQTRVCSAYNSRVSFPVMHWIGWFRVGGLDQTRNQSCPRWDCAGEPNCCRPRRSSFSPTRLPSERPPSTSWDYRWCRSKESSNKSNSESLVTNWSSICCSIISKRPWFCSLFWEWIY